MTKKVFEEIWSYGQKLCAFDDSSADGREFNGFLEPVNFLYDASETRKKAGIVPNEKYRLIAVPTETFPSGTATRIVCGTTEYELLSIKEVYDGEQISHRECSLLKIGEVENNA